MQPTTLGTNGPEVGVIGLGGMGMTYRYDMATARDDNTSIAVIRQALDLGVTPAARPGGRPLLIYRRLGWRR